MIHYTTHNGITKVLIDNGLTKEDEKIFETLLHTNKEINLSFLSTTHISSNIIKLLSLKKENISSITTDSQTLWHYCKKIHIDMRYTNLYHQNKTNIFSIKAIAIGGSAGALNNIIKIVKELPYLDISVFIVVHILPNEKNQLVNILQQCTKYTVREANHGEEIKPYHIYVASPNLHMLVQDHHIYQSKTKKVNFCRPSIDVLFKTLALEYKNSLLAILTCGYLDDGTGALKDIKDCGNISLVQNPNECEANDIPLNAITTKNFTHVLGIKEINKYINEKLNTSIDLSNSVNSLVGDIFTIYGYDFRNYDKSSLKRRVELLRQELNIESFSEFRDKVLDDIHIFKKLFRKLSINVTNFFRDPLAFKEVREDIIPVLESYPHIRIWCSACSSGQEAYSVAILLDEMGLLNKSIIYATDFNVDIIKQAKNGIFPIHEFENFKENYTQSGGKLDESKWFEKNENYIEVKPHIKNKVQFFQHNLATDSEINEFHLVFCRNVLIYFDEKLQNRVFKLIYNSLIRNGFFVLGESETVSNKNGFKKFNEKSKYKIFKKVSTWK
jgi:chemotaxis protein methyltransferase CheR